MARQISDERKGVYYLGLLLQVGGGIGFLVCLIGFATAGLGSVRSLGKDGDPMGFWVGAAVCMVLVGVGAMLRKVGARGVAGSGVVLDPEQAREDLEPWAHAGGGLLKDAMHEAGVGTGGRDEPEEVVKVRCRSCRKLNDEEAKFCDQCGQPL